MYYEIIGGSFPAVNVVLNEGETVITQSGAMAWCDEDVEMSTNAEGGLLRSIGRMFSGASLMFVRHTAQRDGSKITFSASFPGTIKEFRVDADHEYFAQKSAFLVADEGVEVAMIDGVTDNGFGLEWQPLIGGRVVVKAKELLLKSGPLLPVLSLLFSMGFFFWVMLYLGALTFAGKGKDRSLLMFLPSAAVYLTLFIAVPYGRTFRYIYPFVLCVFIFLSAPLRSPSETPDSPQTPAVPDDPSLSPPST